jgi:hypothetical protein
VFVAMLPLAPFLLVVGATRLGTRLSTRLYAIVGRAVKPMAKNLHHVIQRNVIRNPRRSSNIAVIIALGLAYGLLVLAIFHGLVEWDRQAVRAIVGADLAAVPPKGDTAFAAAVSRLYGVAGVTPIVPVPARPPEPSRAIIFALEPTTYFTVAQLEPLYFGDGGVDETRQVLLGEGQVLVSKRYLESAALLVGDRITLRYLVLNQTAQLTEVRTVRVTVGGVVRGLPGTVSSDDQPLAIYGSFATFQSALAVEPYNPPPLPDARLLVDLAESADWRRVRQEILDLGAAEVHALQEEFDSANLNSGIRTVLGFLRMEIAFLFLVLPMGLGLITLAASLERDIEFGGIIARGASRWQAAKVLLGEALIIMFVGTVIGVGVGIAASFVMARAFSAGPPGFLEPFVPFPFVLPIESSLLVGLSAVAMLLSSLLVALRIAGMDVAHILKVRGG